MKQIGHEKLTDMKNYLRKSRHVALLQRNVKLRSDGLYLIQSESAARSMYFESKKQISYAKKMFRRHFAGVIEILSEYYTNKGIAILIRIESEASLMKNWEARGKNVMEVHKVISEVIRYSISAISKNRNRKNGRKGSVVRENFRTFVLKDLISLNEILRMMREGEVELSGQEGRYEQVVEVGSEFFEWDANQDVLREEENLLLKPSQ